VGRFGATARPFGPFGQYAGLAGRSKTAPRILIFPIVLGAEYSFFLNLFQCIEKSEWAMW
jgi:hypothetical protein